MASTCMSQCLGSRSVVASMRPRAARRQAVLIRAEQNGAERLIEEPKTAVLEAKAAVDDSQRAVVPKPMTVPGLPSTWNQAVPNGGVSPTEITKPGGYEVGEAMSFSGPAPEIINGRLAMLGFITAFAAEVATGRPLLQQFQQASGPVVAVAIVFAVASLVPMIKGANLKEENGVFTKQAELWNGRAAMLGFSALILTEWAKGGALF